MTHLLRNARRGLVLRAVALGSLLGMVLGAGFLGGCSASKEQSRSASVPPASKPAAAAPSAPATSPGSKPTAADAKPSARADPEGLKELSPEDRVLAEQQALCPVSKEPLGSMGKPVKVVVGNRTVFLCCAGCAEDFRKEPDTYIAQLTGSKASGHDGKASAHDGPHRAH